MTISFCIHVLNEARVLGRTLGRLRQVKRPMDEIIVVDEGSIDSSPEIAAGLADKLIQMGQPKTISLARNLACFHSKGDIIVSMDPDVLVPTEVASLLQSIFENPAMAACGADCRIWREEEKPIDRALHNLMNLRMRIATALGRPSSRGEFQAFRRKVFERLGGYREDLNFNEDIDIMNRAGRLGRVIFLPRGLYVEESPARYRMFGYHSVYAYWTINFLKVRLGFQLPAYRRISH